MKRRMGKRSIIVLSILMVFSIFLLSRTVFAADFEDCLTCHVDVIASFAFSEYIDPIRVGGSDRENLCFKCHGGYFDPEGPGISADKNVIHISAHLGWGEPLTNPDSPCADCHNKKTCYACHDYVPHAPIESPTYYHSYSTFDPPIFPALCDGTSFETNAPLSCAISGCHGEIGENFVFRPSCTTCHHAALHTLEHDYTDVPSIECLECHDGNVATEHDRWEISCQICHNSTEEAVLKAIENGKKGIMVYCGDCHGEVDHLAAHDKTFFTSDLADDATCSWCHVNAATSIVTEHTSRLDEEGNYYNCATCHNNTDTVIQDAIKKGKGEEGQPVYCVDCHYQAEEPYDIHVEGHDSVCAICHILPEDEEGNTLGIHSRTTRDTTLCTDCHRYGDTDEERNTIFSVSVNAHEEEPPDYDYHSSPYLDGPCLRCHKKNKTNMGKKEKKGCLPCHFNAPKDSWPCYLNDYYGSETWGHNFQKRNNPKKTTSKW